MAIDQPGDQRTPAAVHPREIRRQVETLPDTPNATGLDPHVLFRPERLSVEDLRADDREVDLGQCSVCGSRG